MNIKFHNFNTKDIEYIIEMYFKQLRIDIN